jgi:hypothetical protein
MSYEFLAAPLADVLREDGVVVNRMSRSIGEFEVVI